MSGQNSLIGWVLRPRKAKADNKPSSASRPAKVSKLPAGVKQLNNTPALDLAIADLLKAQGLHYIATPSREHRNERKLNNPNNMFFSVLTVYECMKAVVSQLDMRSLIALAHSCTSLNDLINLDYIPSKENWFKFLLDYEQGQISDEENDETTKKRRREDDEDDVEMESDELAKRVSCRFRCAI